MSEPTTTNAGQIVVSDEQAAGQTRNATAQDAAQPTAEDLQALIAQVQAMQAELNAARGIPTDPVGAAAADLKAHVTARANAGVAAFAELKDAVGKLGETVSSKDSDLLRTLAADVADSLEGAVYIKQLANNLHKNVLSNA